jgi:hypothetical protein
MVWLAIQAGVGKVIGVFNAALAASQGGKFAQAQAQEQLARL